MATDNVVVEKTRTYRVTPRTVYDVTWSDSYLFSGGLGGGGGASWSNPIITCSTLEVAEDMMQLLAKKHI